MSGGLAREAWGASVHGHRPAFDRGYCGEIRRSEAQRSLRLLSFFETRFAGSTH